MRVAGITMDINITGDWIVVSRVRGDLATNFTVSCASGSFNATELVSNGTIYMANEAGRARAARLIGVAARELDEAITAGRVYDTSGKNQTSTIAALISNASASNQSGQYGASISLSRQSINHTGLLLNSSTYASLKVQHDNMTAFRSAIEWTLFLSPRASAIRAKALQEAGFALDSWNRGSAWWFAEHVARANAFILEARLVEAADFPIMIQATAILPAFFACMAFVGVAARRALRKRS